jgi:phosphoribosylamine--glycine ligase/phosphoribosylformylglycinamidine cyclo-ligase
MPVSRETIRLISMHLTSRTGLKSQLRIKTEENMNILIIGSGGREHAIAWKIAQSPHCSQLFIAPGNAGTSSLGKNVPVNAENVPGLVSFASENAIDLVIVGPESALAAGVVDALQAAGLRVFGPTRAAAQIESSKAFAKAFMKRHGIPTARFATFPSYTAALEYLDHVDYPLVVKTSGLAAGKGVILPESDAEARTALRSIMVDRIFGTAGEEIIIEERLSGEEVSLLAFSDGFTVCPMPPAQDHKRLLDGDQGPNTGGMGAYAPAPVCPPAMVEELTRTILQPTIDGLREEGRPFVGILYAGLMLTSSGPQVLEFNCRFGDPETQVLLPLLESDLVELAEACIDYRLDRHMPRWKEGFAATVVLASQGYPGKVITGKRITGPNRPPNTVLIFHASTKEVDGEVQTAGGRVLNVTGCGPTVPSALSAAYSAIQDIHFEGMQYRSDIAHRALPHPSPVQKAEPTSAVQGSASSGAYASSGVNIDAGNRAVAMMKDAVRSTYTPAVLAGIGAFGGLYDAGALQRMHAPVLVASTDGVGTKVRLAVDAGRYETIGADIVNHCINDILVQGARPVFFLDYFACSKLDPQIVSRVVAGVAAACRASGCVLLGGETAEMPGVYEPGAFDLAGTIVGVIERASMLPREDLFPGDLLVGLASSGPHTNGYSLIRRIFQDVSPDTVFPELGAPLADVLLAPHRSYHTILEKALGEDTRPVKALAHLTGGGFVENIPRVLPDGLQAVIHLGSWSIPPLYPFMQERGNIDPVEMYRVFNMGIGMVAVVAPGQLETFTDAVREKVWVIGELVAGEKGVILK